MIRVSIEQKQGPVARRVDVTAPSIVRALKLAGADDPRTNVRVLSPTDDGRSFAPATDEGIDYEIMTPDEIEAAHEAGLPGAYEAWTDFLKDDLGGEGFEACALENGLV